MITFVWILLGVFFSGFYSLVLFQFYRGLSQVTSAKNSEQFTVTIIVPARNEERTIANCLQALIAQTYPSHLIEIIVVDDNSTDNTLDIITRFTKTVPQVKLLSLTEMHPSIAPKKWAITQGIAGSKHEIIFTVDADCEMSHQWLETMISYFTPNTGMVVGPVLYHPGQTIFQKLQAIEFLGLVAAGAGSIGAGHPIIANGANLGYRRQVFSQVKGFAGHEGLLSGDDDLFLQKVVQETQWSIQFAIDFPAIVYTRPMETLSAFFQQRARWASKGKIYHNLTFKFFLISTYFYYLFLAFSPLLVACDQLSLFSLSSFCALKWGAEFLIIDRGCRLFRQEKLIKYFLLAELVHIPYILYVGWRGFHGNFQWKGRVATIK